MSTFRPSIHIRTLALAALSAFAVRAPAQTFSRTFTTSPIKKSGLSVWPAGQDTGSNLSSVFIGPSWDLSGKSLDAYGDLSIPAIDWGAFTTPAVDLGRTGFQVRYGGAGKIGFDVQPYYSGGNMNLTYAGAVTVSGLPSLPQPGQTINLSLSYRTAGSSNFSVTSPTVGVGMDGVFNLSGNASSTGWFLGDTVWNGDLFTSFSTSNRATIFPLTTLTPGDHVNQVASALNGLNLVNPLPISASVSAPDLSVVGNTLNTSTGALTGTSFSTFCTVETDAFAWILMLVPAAKAAIANFALSGNYPVPGTGTVAGWDFAKMYADMNLGFTANYAVTPTTTLGVDVYKVYGDGTEELYQSSNTNTISFSMPTTRIRVQPRVGLDLSLATNLGFGMQGEIGTSPLKLTLDGSVGSGSRAETYHVNVDPAHLAWTSDPKGLSNIKSVTVPLGHIAQTLDGTYVSLANYNDLPPYIYPGTAAGTDFTDGAPLNIAAYSFDPDQTDTGVYTVYLAPQQGYTFLASSSGSSVSATVVPAAPGGYEGTITPLPPFFKFQGTVQTLDLQFRGKELKPGRYTLITKITGSSSRGLAQSTYRTPLNINYQKGVIDGQFFREGDPAYSVNRILANGIDQSVQFSADNLYDTTEVVMNGSVVLPRDATGIIPVQAQDCRFTVPAGVAARFAGQANTIQLRTRDLSGDGTGFLLSDPKPLFIVAGQPALSGIQYNDVANAELPLGDRPVTFEVDGVNLSQATTVSAVWTRDGASVSTPLPTVYATPGALRVTLGTDFLTDFHGHSSNGSLLIQATTPRATVPGDHYNTQTLVSGGTSGLLSVVLRHAKPTITRFDPGILVKDGGPQTVRVYGDNLLRGAGGVYGGSLASGFGAGATVTYPAGTGLTVPYLTVSLPADHPAVTEAAPHSFQVNYGDVASDPNALLTEFGAPSIDTGTTYRVPMGPNIDSIIQLSGAPIYKSDTHVLLNGVDVGSPLDVPSATSAKVRIPSSLTGSSATVALRNPAPGGGDSNAVTVALLEANPNAVTVVPGALVFDRSTNTYRQSFAVTYTGSRDVSQGARIMFDSVPSGVTLTNASGTVDGKPYLATSLVPRRQVTVVAIWRKTGSSAINSSNTVAFPY